MPILILQSDPLRGGLLSGRVLIGRWSVNTIAIDDQTVSRIHAWITHDGKRYFITDGSSYNGTLINGLPIGRRHPLKGGDLIELGAISLTFHETDVLPPGVKSMDLTPKDLSQLQINGLFFVECPCGAPLLVKKAFAGKSGRCRFCGRNHLLMPAPAAGAELLEFEDLELAAPSATAPGAASEPCICGVCHAAIGGSDVMTPCPSCGLKFHDECWAENRGCAAYGCSQVGILGTSDNSTDHQSPALETEDNAEHSAV
jgi:hypothetical protein